MYVARWPQGPATVLYLGCVLGTVPSMSLILGVLAGAVIHCGCGLRLVITTSDNGV